MVRTISSTSLETTQSGNASTSANALNNAHLPSITGMPAIGPISPRPSTAVTVRDDRNQIVAARVLVAETDRP